MYYVTKNNYYIPPYRRMYFYRMSILSTVVPNLILITAHGCFGCASIDSFGAKLNGAKSLSFLALSPLSYKFRTTLKMNSVLAS